MRAVGIPWSGPSGHNLSPYPDYWLVHTPNIDIGADYDRDGSINQRQRCHDDDVTTVVIRAGLIVLSMAVGLVLTACGAGAHKSTASGNKSGASSRARSSSSEDRNPRDQQRAQSA